MEIRDHIKCVGPQVGARIDGCLGPARVYGCCEKQLPLCMAHQSEHWSLFCRRRWRRGGEFVDGNRVSVNTTPMMSGVIVRRDLDADGRIVHQVELDDRMGRHEYSAEDLTRELPSMNMEEAADAYSANVRLELWLQDRKLALAQIGPSDVILRESYSSLPGEARVVMRVDGRQHVWSVTLPDGIAPESRVVRTTNRRYEDECTR